MARRWKPNEEEILLEIRKRLKDELAARPQFPEVVGDRRLVRFMRGKGWKIDETVKAIKDFLKWRDDNKVDKIRQDIVYGGKDSPMKFPFGEMAIEIAPQIVISSHAQDKTGRLLVMETFDFSPKELFEVVQLEDYLTFLTYTLEYRALVLEQVSHEREQKYLAEHPNAADREDGYGVTVMDYTIRDLKGVGMGHIGSKGRALVSAALELSLPNYPEYLDRCVLINVPWVFNTFWYFVKGLIDEITLVKINLCGADYLPVLLEEISIENIPERLGGKFALYNEAFVFDRSAGGPLYYEGCPAEPSREQSTGDGGTNSSSGNIRGSSGDGGGKVIRHYFDTPTRTPSQHFLYTLTLLSILQIILHYALRKPAKALLLTVTAGMYMYLRESGYLQWLVYPVLVYVTIFNTKPILFRVSKFFDIDVRF